MVERVARLLLHERLGIEGDAEAGVEEHIQVVGTITNSNHLLGHQPTRLAQRLDEVALALAVDDGADDTASELAVLHLQLIGEGVVHAKVGFDLVGNLLEATRDDGELEAEALEHLRHGTEVVAWSRDGVQQCRGLAMPCLECGEERKGGGAQYVRHKCEAQTSGMELRLAWMRAWLASHLDEALGAWRECDLVLVHLLENTLRKPLEMLAPHT